MTLGKELVIVSELLWFWALADCIMTGADSTWPWILLIGNLPAALVYWFIYKNPAAQQKFPPLFLKRWAYQQQIMDAEEEARQIGNAIQYIELADLLREVGDPSNALLQYKKALEKESKNARALWGVVKLASERGKLTEVRHSLETLLVVDPDWEAGEAALLYIRLLVNSGESAAAQQALHEYAKEWDDPEAKFYEANFLIQKGEAVRAKEVLEMLIEDVRNSAANPYRRNRPWMIAAKKRLGELKKNAMVLA